MILLAISLGLAAAADEPAETKELSPTQLERSRRIRHTFDTVRSDSLNLLDDLYADEITFEDPLGKFEGLDAFKVYMSAMYQYVEDIQWTYTDEVIQGDTHALYWTMTLKTRGLNKGKPFSVDGTSLLKFGTDNKVIYHRDYFDMGAYVYERVPVVRWFVKLVKKRLHKAVASVETESDSDGRARAH